jgi:diguanylate cyclase (GGDEF)-like protein
MIRKLKKRLRLGGLVAGLVLAASAAAPLLSLRWVDEARAERDRVEGQVGQLERVASLLVDAETGQRGYVITGRDDFLLPYHQAVDALPGALAELRRVYAPESEPERAVVTRIEENARHKLAELGRTVQLRAAQGFATVEPIVSEGSGKRYMDAVRLAATDLAAREAKELGELEADLAHKIRWAVLLAAASTLTSILVFALLGRTLWQAVLRREELSETAQQANLRLEEGMAALRTRNDEVSALGEMARVLQTEMSLKEALEVTALFCGRLLPGTDGVVHLFRNSADILERAAAWGSVPDGAPPTMEPKSYWGLRLGHPHCCDDRNNLHCGHYRAGNAAWRVCIPLMAYGEVLGLMELSARDGAAVLQDTLAATAQTIAEQVALSLSNAKLRQVLRDQSIKDPLTGLFNRRYMEETLARELARAERQRTPLAVIVADLDHFKSINDTYGHPAGDAVLKKAGQHLGSSVRGGDVACRYGGEEFILILPDCAKEAAMAKAADLCDHLGRLSFADGGAGIQVTASFGVAAFPLDGVEPQGLIEAADAALYVAKKTGRNRVVAAGAAAPAASERPVALALD